MEKSNLNEVQTFGDLLMFCTAIFLIDTLPTFALLHFFKAALYMRFSSIFMLKSANYCEIHHF